jgi:hypothetical protein
MVIVPAGIGAELLARLRADAPRLGAYTADVRRGDFDNDWVDRLLGEHGCPLEPPE